MSDGAPDQGTARDAAYWARTVSTLKLGKVPPEAVNLNVSGKRLVGPIQGFGRMWQRTYRVELRGAEVTPAEVISIWKEQFATFWPKRGRFYGPARAIAPGDVALLNLDILGRLQLATGIMVLYADEESFTFINPQGHMFAGWITFSAAVEGGTTIAQAQVLVRANDPLYELAMPLGLSRIENKFWQQTLGALAARFGGQQATVQTTIVCVDRRRRWANARNLRHNAGISSALYAMATPLRLVAKPLRTGTGGDQPGRAAQRVKIPVGSRRRCDPPKPPEPPRPGAAPNLVSSAPCQAQVGKIH